MAEKAKLALMIAAIAGLCVPHIASAQGATRRRVIVRQGNAWVEHAECETTVKPGSRLILRSDTGSVHVETASGTRVACNVTLRAFTKTQADARRLLSNFKLSVRRLPDGGAFLNGTFPLRERKAFAANYRISAPQRLSLDLETRGGDVSVPGPVQGMVHVTTAAGNIRIGPVSGSVQVATAGGNITLGNIGSGADARTAGGTIRAGNVKGNAFLESNGGGIVAGQIGGSFKAETAGGDVALKSAGGPIQAETSGGQILIGKAGGSIRAETAGGGVRVENARGNVHVESAGGSIDLFQLQGPVQAMTRQGSIVAQIAAGGKLASSSTLATSTGDVQVYLPQNMHITIDAAIQDAAGHRIISDFPVTIESRNNNLLRTTVRGRAVLNGGGEVLRIRSVGGNIEIYKLNKETMRKLNIQKADYWKPVEVSAH